MTDSETGDPTIPAEFVLRAQQHLLETGEPLLEYRSEAYDTVLLASGDGRYQLSMADWEPPFTTWREYFEAEGLEGEEIHERIAEEGLGVPEREDAPEDEDDPELLYDLDAEMQFAEQYWPPRDTETGLVYSLLEDLPLPDKFECPELVADRGFDLGQLDFIEGPCPGNDFTGVSVTSPLGLSCLQYLLDELNSGIQIELARND